MSYGSKPTPAPSKPPPAPPVYTPMWMVCIGWIISALPALALIASGVMKISGFKPPEGTMPDIGWKEDAMFGLAIIEIVGGVLYLIPFTAVLGAVILTAYIGGAIATHVRIGDHFELQLLIGVLLWLGLVFRDARLRGMLPFRGVSDSPAGPSGCLSAIGVLFLTLIIVIVVLVGIANALPEDFRFARSTTIDATPADVFPQVNDFNNWKPWNPFTKPDPNIKITIEGKPGVGQTYKWSSENQQVGAGAMTITESEPNDRIKIHLEFEAPMKDTADAIFTFKGDKDNKTDVTWTMEGKSDVLKKSMRGIDLFKYVLGPKFDDGLSELKNVAESKKTPEKKQ